MLAGCHSTSTKKSDFHSHNFYNSKSNISCTYCIKKGHISTSCCIKKNYYALSFVKRVTKLATKHQGAKRQWESKCASQDYFVSV